MKKFLPYATLIIFLVIISSLGQWAFGYAPSLIHDIDLQLLVLGGVLFIGYYINRIAPHTAIPSFVWAIFAGMAMQPMLATYTSELNSVKILMEVFAAIILFSGGLDIPFKNFKKWFFPIASLSLVGVILSSVFFAVALSYIASWFGLLTPELLPSIVILSAALASTDPTAIIPTLATLRFKRSYIKQIAISESALTDVSGSILTRFLLLAMLGAAASTHTGLFSYFTPLINKTTYDALALQILTGIIVGYIGFMLIKRFYSENGTHSTGHKEADPALLVSVPIFTFVLGNVLGGAGFLAAFMAGLFSDIGLGLRQASRFTESLLNHLIKPFIFIMLGALVPVATLLDLAPIGILSAFVFMFVIRPLVVFISLLPWIKQFTFSDLLFLSFIRETGIIAAILLIIAATFSIITSQFVIAIGMWVILLTLVIEPPLTPYIARKIGVLSDRPSK
ncbi:MAG: cation:proton antiporter [Patescibacteria group bacterium]